MTEKQPNEVKQAQLLTTFPNDNQKRIDYVIAYKYDQKDQDDESFQKKEAVRQEFLKLLHNETINVYTIKFRKKDDWHVYYLLNCPIDRLLDEAERVKLEMKICTTYVKDMQLDDIKFKIFDSVQNACWKMESTKSDGSGNLTIMASFSRINQYLFDKCDDESLKDGIGTFNTRLRCLLMDSILSNLSFATEKKRNRVTETFGLNQLERDGFRHRHAESGISPTTSVASETNLIGGLDDLLNDDYFNDAFILHEPSLSAYHQQTMLEYIASSSREDPAFMTQKKKEIEKYFNDLDESQDENPTNVRNHLHKIWASPKNFFKMQPFMEVRDYFGEQFTLYYAWAGNFIFTLYFPSLIGLVFFIAGLVMSSHKFNRNNSDSSNQTKTGYGDYYANLFAESFDNRLTPYFALILSLWGAIQSVMWQRENAYLAYEWDVSNYEKDEPDLPEYTRREREKFEKLKDRADIVKYLYSTDRIFKAIVSYIILFIMVALVGLIIALTVLYRIYMNVLFTGNSPAQIIIGDIGSTLINSISIIILDAIYDRIAKKLTEWENHRTKTEFDDALIYKLFSFEFVNCYGSLFYLAYFRNIYYPNGIFGLGSQYQDTCNGSCMSLLTVQVLQILFIKPLPFITFNFILPYIRSVVVKRKTTKILESLDSDDSEITSSLVTREKLNEEMVYFYVASEQSKPKCEPTIIEQYMLVTLIYGYVMMFACSFCLGPLLMQIIIAITLRADALRCLWLFRRPVGERAQDIGSWHYIINFLNVVGIVNNAFLIGFVSVWSETDYLANKTSNRFIFVVIFEHVVFMIWLFIVLLLPKVSPAIEFRMRLERKTAREIMSSVTIVKENVKKTIQLIFGMRGLANPVLTQPTIREENEATAQENRITNQKLPRIDAINTQEQLRLRIPTSIES